MQAEAPISFTENAKNELLERIKQHQLKDVKIRVGAKGQGLYVLAFDQLQQNDKQYKIDEFDVLISPKDMIFVLGLQIDYGVKGKDKGFIFNTP